MPFEGYELGEVTELAKAIYQEKIKHLVEPAENGKFIVIDVKSGDYEIDEEHIPAIRPPLCAAAQRRGLWRPGGLSYYLHPQRKHPGNLIPGANAKRNPRCGQSGPGRAISRTGGNQYAV